MAAAAPPSRFQMNTAATADPNERGDQRGPRRRRGPATGRLMGERNPDVDAWLERYDNPMKEAVQRTREILLGADPRIAEVIKWSTPTFVYRGNLASFQPRARQFVSLLVHAGASIPGDHPLLQGGGDTARYARLADVEAVERARPGLEALVRAWCDARDA